MKYFLTILFVSFTLTTKGQDDEIYKKEYFSDFLKGPEKSILIVGENHASAVGAYIFPNLIEYLNKEVGLKTLLVEFGPSEAYWYTKYLNTGNEKHLNYTLYAGAYPAWKDTWRWIYEYNKTLEEPLQIIGVDFDRTRTVAYALYSMFMAYEEKPDYIDSLMAEIRTDEFYKTYTIGYPTDKDKQWTAEMKDLLQKNINDLEKWLKAEDFEMIEQVIKNKAVGYDGEREQALGENTARIIRESKEDKFLMLIGRSHAYIKAIYDDNPRLATMLKNEEDINVLTGVILFQNSELRGGKGEPVNLIEIENKIPWKDYTHIIRKKLCGDFTVIPLKKGLKPLAAYTDFILVAQNQKPIETFK